MPEAEAVFVGTVTDALDEDLSVYRTPNGSAVIFGDRGSRLAFDPGPLAEFADLLGRVAMLGQAVPGE